MDIHSRGKEEAKVKYTYKCNHCNHELDKDLKLEQVLNTAKSPKVICPKCKGTMRKLIVSAPVHFKGSGWGKDKK